LEACPWTCDANPEITAIKVPAKTSFTFNFNSDGPWFLGVLYDLFQAKALNW